MLKNIILISSISFALSSNLCADTFTLKSTELSGQLTNEQVFSGFGCTGKNISPELNWQNAPENTKSFAVTVYDMDAPTAPIGEGGFWHWNIFNIPAKFTKLKTNAGNIEAGEAPKGAIQALTSFGASGFGGACPPKNSAEHAYIFTVYALKIDNLGLDKNASPAVVGFMLEQNTIQKASLISYYKR